MMVKKIRIAIAGVGNCASSLVQGIQYYSNKDNKDGVIFESIGGYHVDDIEVVAAFDIANNKVGRDLSEALYAEPNNTRKFEEVLKTGVIVKRGPTLDGLGEKLRDLITESSSSPIDVSEELLDKKADILINYMPVGADKASKHYAESAIEAGCAFINAMPTFIVSDDYWDKKFGQEGLPCIGDDIKSQLGATILHRTLVNLFNERGIKVTKTHQLNYGGNSDFYNMQEPDRLSSKLTSKKEAVTYLLKNKSISENIFIGPAGYIPWLKDRKHADILIKGENFGGDEVEIELKLKVTDSPNSGGVMVDSIRCAKLALERRESGSLVYPSATYMKHPPVNMTDEEARNGLLNWIEESNVDK